MITEDWDDRACEKCGAIGMATVKYVCAFFIWPHQISDLTHGCVYGRCPSGEHLHVECECGFKSTQPCVGQELGEPVQRGEMLVIQSNEQRHWWWPF